MEHLAGITFTDGINMTIKQMVLRVSMVWVQIPSREEQKFDSSKI
jgi:hypothetical protein